ncbi:MAG: sarcosine oxidase subunit gamma family protein [Woeseiaceae bacterium]|nr:sarcosine oxidase subunit gamma family protein [Woeseiaceae bacterium]
MTGYDVTIESLPTCGFLDLRGGEAVREACSEFLGISLPTAANTLVSGADDRLAHCISPGHWILQVADGVQKNILRGLELSSNDLSHSFVDVSDMYSRIQLSGTEVRELLTQGVSIDIHPRVFPAGSSARTGLAKTTALLICVDESPTFILTVFSSYRRYVLDWMQYAGGKN